MPLLKAQFKTSTFSETQCSLGLFCAQRKKDTEDLGGSDEARGGILGPPPLPPPLGSSRSHSTCYRSKQGRLKMQTHVNWA